MPGGAFQNPDIPMDVEQKFSHREHRGHRVAIWGSDLVSCQAALSKIQCPMDVEQKFSHREHRGHRVVIWGSDLVSCQAALSNIQCPMKIKQYFTAEHAEDTELQKDMQAAP